MKFHSCTSISKSFLILAAVVVFFFPVAKAHALTISPAKIEVSGDPGQTVSGKFILINEQGREIKYYTSVENFEARGETGQPSFVKDNTGLASWITIDKELTLQKDEKLIVPFTIKIPEQTDAGGYFSAIFMSTNPESTDGGQVSVGAKIGVLVLLHVSGPVKEGGGVLEFNTNPEGKRFYTSLPVSFFYRYSNTGNDRVKPEGFLKVKNILGWKKADLPINSTDGNVLPDSVRRFNVQWGDAQPVKNDDGFFDIVKKQWHNFSFGVYKAKLDFTHLKVDSGQTSLTIVIIPWQLLLIIFGGLLILGFGFTKLIKIYNHWLIAQVVATRKRKK